MHFENEDIIKIVKAVRDVPTDPVKTLNSRRGQAIEIRGDAIVFSVEEDTTDPEFVRIVREAQQAMYEIFERDLNLIGKTWTDKESRHQDKHFKKQEKIHFAFGSTISPSDLKEYLEKKSLHTPEKIARASKLLSQFINQDEMISAKVKECKINPDGHVVIRMDIHPAEKLIHCKEELSAVFGSTYNRYADPEKQKTLAAVICVVDFNKLSPSARASLELVVRKLEEKLKSMPVIPLKSIEWIDYRKRTLSTKSRLNVRTFPRTREQIQQSLWIPFLLLSGAGLALHHSRQCDSKPKYPAAPSSIIRKQYMPTSFRGQSFTTFPRRLMTKELISLAQRGLRAFRK